MTGVVLFMAVLVGLLAIPLTLTFQVSWQEVSRNDAELKWAFGLVRKRILPTESKPGPSKSEQVRRRIGRYRRPTRKKPAILSALLQKDFRRRITRFVHDVWHAVHKEDVTMRLRIGLGDPADTGQLWAFLGPVSGMLGSVQNVSVKIEPEFVDETLEFVGNGSIRIIPMQMIYLAAALMLSPPIWRAIIKWMRTDSRE
jgi:hypothetical protein